MGLREQAEETVRTTLTEAGIDWETGSDGTYVATLPGVRKLKTNCALRVGEHALTVNAFVIRKPDENHAAFYRWLLERNSGLYGVAFALDQLGDVYLTGRISLGAVTAQEIDRLLGVVLQTSDDSFNTLLELGFATAICREWDWRVSKGESLKNLEAFADLVRRREQESGHSAAPENR